MGHSQASKASAHQRIVEIAAKRFRELGIDGIAVTDVMKEAGLTVGGFYKHFVSREQLVAEALTEAFTDLDDWESQATGLVQLLQDKYLSEEHRDDPGSGCGICALVADVSKSSPVTRKIYTDRLEKSLGVTESLLDIQNSAEKRARAILMISASVGAVNLSRAVSDPELSREILKSVATQLAPLLPEITTA